LAIRRILVGHQLFTEHGSGNVAHFVEAFGDFHPTGLATSARVNLGLDYPSLSSQACGSGARIGVTGCHFSPWSVHSKIA
jgi:hypothetical protein